MLNLKIRGKKSLPENPASLVKRLKLLIIVHVSNKFANCYESSIKFAKGW
jgi:hypothetical protein